MIFKKDTKVIVNNNSRKEVGKVLRTWMRKGVQYYNIETERGSILEQITTEPTTQLFVDIEWTKKTLK